MKSGIPTIIAAAVFVFSSTLAVYGLTADICAPNFCKYVGGSCGTESGSADCTYANGGGNVPGGTACQTCAGASPTVSYCKTALSGTCAFGTGPAYEYTCGAESTGSCNGLGTCAGAVPSGGTCEYQGCVTT